MTGLEKIIKEIELESREAGEALEKDAQRQVNEIMKRAEDEAKEKESEIFKKAEEKCAEIEKRGKSGSELAKKKVILKAKQEIIAKMIQKAHEKLLNLPEDEYFENILKMVSKHSQEKAGEIAFSERDLRRLPLNFTTLLDKSSKGKLEISSKPVKIDGGFVLIYGGIEENCSFEGLFSQNHEKLQDAVASMLFI